MNLPMNDSKLNAKLKTILGDMAAATLILERLTVMKSIFRRRSWLCIVDRVCVECPAVETSAGKRDVSAVIRTSAQRHPGLG